MSTIHKTYISYPWSGLRDFVTRHRNDFPQGTETKVSFTVHVENSTSSPDEQEVSITFAYPKDPGGVVISAKTKFPPLAVESEARLNLEEGKGQITLPQFNSRAILGEVQSTIETPEGAHQDIRKFTADALLFLKDALELILLEDSLETIGRVEQKELVESS